MNGRDEAVTKALPESIRFAFEAAWRLDHDRTVIHAWRPHAIHCSATEPRTHFIGGLDALVNAARTARLPVLGGHRHRGPLSIGAGYVVEGVIAQGLAPVAGVPAS